MKGRIRVGFNTYTYYQLSFSSYSVLPVPSSTKDMYIHILSRNNEPLIIVTTNKMISLSQFPGAHLPTLDYPTLPFIKMLRLLELQEDIFLEYVSESYRERKSPCCQLLGYVEDIIGLLRFALQRRGV